MKRYRLINNITGWVVFIIAAITYLMTIEPTASLWDCGEFIASGYKLEVGHPPGNAVFMIMARFFTLFAGGNVAKVAAMVNAMSALVSAFTILFLFWTITHLARKILAASSEAFSTGRLIAIMGAGVVGALAYTFSDSFWFSAVEGEVYASSSLFTALVFWAILKWEDVADEPHSNRWLILIAFLMGLSIGVHLLNLLALPAIVLVYYFRKYTFTWKGFLISTGLSLVMLGLILYGIIPGMVIISSKFDYLFVNKFGLPVNSGMVFHVLLVAVFFVLAVRSTLRNDKPTTTAVLSALALALSGIWVVSGSGFLNIIILAGVAGFAWYITLRDKAILNMVLTTVTVILIGYSSTAIVVIRSSANTPLDENNPENPYNLLYFLNREQYGQRPLFKGAYFNAPIKEYKEGKPKYTVVNGKYEVTSHDIERVYDERFETIFPRMWSDQPEHEEPYKQWSRMKGVPVQVVDPSTGEKKTVRKPTFGENLRFMFSYQLDYMYFRYFMWNFSGRQNDIQGFGGSVNGNWITGLDFLDKMRIGSSDMPADMKNDPSRNVYFLLPFILGVIGMLYQLNRDTKNWWIILLLFIMTGLAIVFYLNQYPSQPRERDYAYAGSFYFFAVWIGLGVLAFFEWISKLVSEKIAAPAASVLCLFAVPVIMGTQNWDDHDRSGRYLARDVASNYLNSCAKDAILFTNGDNDTFPLWYAQEVEKVRTDVRVCNLMLLNTDWYVDQMKRRTYESAPLPLSLPQKKYYDGVNNQVYIYEKTKDAVDIETVLKWVMSENPDTKLRLANNEVLDAIPSRTIRIPVDKEKVLASGTVRPEDADKIVPYIDIRLKGSAIMKSQLIILDILANNKWERPIYFVTGYHNDAMGLEEYFQLEGVAYRLVPIRSQNNSWLDYGRVDTDILYENMMKKFSWRGAPEPGVNIDYNHRRTIMVVKARYNYSRLAKALAGEGKNEKAKEVLDYCMKTFPVSKISYDMFIPDIAEGYFAAGDTTQALQLTRSANDYYFEKLDYYMKQDPSILASAEYEVQTAFQIISRTGAACETGRQDAEAKKISLKLREYYDRYVKLLQPGKTN
ncbi:MAG: DUF2723 domain-containing protein [Bacteroidales bacterium]